MSAEEEEEEDGEVVVKLVEMMTGEGVVKASCVASYIQSK